MRLKTKFQDEDFDLGEVVEANVYYGGSGRIKVIAEPAKGGVITFYFETLKGMNEMFEDATEEPKEFWYIENDGDIDKETYDGDDYEKRMIKIGNYFSSREEAEKAVGKLKAMAKLKEFGFRFIDWELDMKTIADGKIWFDIGVNTEWDAERLLELKPEVKKSLDILFGGEE